MWFDTHAHLSDPKFNEDRDDAVARAFSQGVSSLVEIADGPKDYEHARRLSEKYKGRIWWAAGLHPYFADQAQPAVWEKLREAASHPQFVAVGEVGLDYAKCPIPPDDQKKALITALALSKEVNKPLIIHCRNAFADLIPILKSFFDPPLKEEAIPGVIHCFSGTHEDANAVLQMGFYVGVDGPLTYPNAKTLRDVISTIPLERIVIETDSPYLPPQDHRGQRNEPGYLPLIGGALADLKRQSAHATATVLSRNSLHLFRLEQAVKSI